MNTFDKTDVGFMPARIKVSEVSYLVWICEGFGGKFVGPIVAPLISETSCLASYEACFHMPSTTQSAGGSYLGFSLSKENDSMSHYQKAAQPELWLC